jgi:uncharacterized protein YbaR (Trm112 family)
VSAGADVPDLDPLLLDVIVCPDCRSALTVGTIPDGTGAELVCQGCGLVYPVRDGIPVLLVDEAVRR